MKSVIYIIFLSLFLFGCAILPHQTPIESTRIYTGPGPEDIVLDTIHPKVRMLVSCSQRRKSLPSHAEIWSIDLETNKTEIMKRTGEPENFRFNPHGIDLRNTSDEQFLYVVNHDDIQPLQSVVKYKVESDKLIFIQNFSSPVLISPNDVCWAPGVEFYFSNDASKRGNYMEALLKLKGGNIATCVNPENWKHSKNKFAYPNGLIFNQNDLYFSTVRQNKILRFPKADLTQKPQTVCKLVGGDNITEYKGNLIVASHLRPLAFVRHMNDSTKNSPSVVYWVNPETHSKKVLYADKGMNINAASTAVYYKGNLYISQVFNGYVLKVKTGNID